MGNLQVKKVNIFLFLFLFNILLYGCAGTTGTIHPIAPVEKNSNLCKFQNLEISSTVSSGTHMEEYELRRIEGIILRKIKEKGSSCFEKITNKLSNKPSTLLLKIEFTRYEKGNAFARAMLAGLGQIHIDAFIRLVDKSNKDVLGTYKVTKTFAWGGIYGGTTRIEDVEPAFAEAVAETIFPNEAEITESQSDYEQKDREKNIITQKDIQVPSIEEKLSKLKKMVQEGLISEDDYQKKKNELLESY